VEGQLVVRRKPKVNPAPVVRIDDHGNQHTGGKALSKEALAKSELMKRQDDRATAHDIAERQRTVDWVVAALHWAEPLAELGTAPAPEDYESGDEPKSILRALGKLQRIVCRQTTIDDRTGEDLLAGACLDLLTAMRARPFRLGIDQMRYEHNRALRRRRMRPTLFRLPVA